MGFLSLLARAFFYVMSEGTKLELMVPPFLPSLKKAIKRARVVLPESAKLLPPFIFAGPQASYMLSQNVRHILSRSYPFR